MPNFCSRLLTTWVCRCYGTRYPGGGNVGVTIDGEQMDSFNASGYEQQYPLWSYQNLDSCPHTLVITTTNCPISSCAPCTGPSCPPCFDPCLSIDFFRSVLPRTQLFTKLTSPLDLSMKVAVLQTCPFPGWSHPGQTTRRSIQISNRLKYSPVLWVGPCYFFLPWSRSLLGVFYLSYQYDSSLTKGPSTTSLCSPVISLLIIYVVAWYRSKELESSNPNH